MPTPADLLQDLLNAAVQKLAGSLRAPVSTYRLQFHLGFKFADATRIVPYLNRLGITHVYVSPILKARAGSTHGYDVVDHSTLNPELGTAADFDALVDALHAKEMGLIVDIVPNHMGVGANDNAWWNDCLQNGPASRFADYFDIAWDGSPRSQLHDRILLPVLGEPFGTSLETGKIKLIMGPAGLAIAHYDRLFPLSPKGYARVLGERLDAARPTLLAAGIDASELQAIAGEQAAEQRGPRLADLTRDQPAVKDFVDQCVARFNGTPGDSDSFNALEALLSVQFYRLAFWRTAPDEINYRRFFDINDLAALRSEREEVFEDSHAFIMALVGQGKVDGLRIDHPDGLLDPRTYFLRLQRRAVLEFAKRLCATDPRFSAVSPTEAEPELRKMLGHWDGGETPLGNWPLYVSAEKILAGDEPLPTDWAVHGATGYDFIAKVNGMFVDESGGATFTQRYGDWTSDSRTFADIALEKKRLILRISLASELQMLALRLDRLTQQERHWHDLTLGGIRDALREVIAFFPVYRSYVSREPVSSEDRRLIESAVAMAIEQNHALQPVLKIVCDVLLLKYPGSFDAAQRGQQREFVGKFQQLTAPVTAKGIEDTAFYIYNRLVSLNEVGADPGEFGLSPVQLHEWLADRQRDWPYALNPLSTHDTKRSEDVRARLNVLSEFPEEWWQRVTRWSRLNEPHRRGVNGSPSPGLNDEYLIYQTLVGAWPIERASSDPGDAFVSRIQQYMLKAMREAKVNTRWTEPNVDYEKATTDFIAAVLSRDKSPLFLQDFRTFQRRVSQFGLLNSLSQTLLRLTAPGVPDTYQGTELWDLSLVDPDNRRPVDYLKREAVVDALSQAFEATGQRAELAERLIKDREDGRVKEFVSWRCLTLRRENPELFLGGQYIQVEAVGESAGNVFSFIRRHRDMLALVVVPRFCSQLGSAGEMPLGREAWGETSLLLPSEFADVRFEDRFTSARLQTPKSDGEHCRVPVADMLKTFPISLLVASA